MQVFHRAMQWFAVMLLVLTTCRCQEDDSRRSVTEHQLMHDRGRNIQSLKRLIWLSSAMEGLHTAQTRSAALTPAKVLSLAVNPSLGSAQPAVRSLLRDFFNPYLAQLADTEP